MQAKPVHILGLSGSLRRATVFAAGLVAALQAGKVSIALPSLQASPGMDLTEGGAAPPRRRAEHCGLCSGIGSYRVAAS